MTMWPFRIVSRMENVTGKCLFKIPLKDDWYFGLVFSDDFSEFFIGKFKKGWH